MTNKLKLGLLITLALISSFSLGFFTSKLVTPKNFESESIEAKEIREKGYTFINPLLECEYINSQGNTKLKDIKNEIEKVVSTKSDQTISLYYRDLLNGPWYGYNENEAFAPQSLLKLPIIFAYLKIADEDPSILDKEILYKEKIDSNLLDENNLEIGQSYNTNLLIQRTIQLSDNVSFELLVDNLPIKYVEQVHEDLNIPYPSKNTPNDFVSVKSYSSIFRVLYNSSYLSRKNSEYLLSLLSESEFNKGLIAGVPENVIVAHKFGIKNASEKEKTTQLHDCGVIYHPENPYLLCIMTKGTDQPAQTNTIKELSTAIYQVISHK